MREQYHSQLIELPIRSIKYDPINNGILVTMYTGSPSKEYKILLDTIRLFKPTAYYNNTETIKDLLTTLKGNWIREHRNKTNGIYNGSGKKWPKMAFISFN